MEAESLASVVDLGQDGGAKRRQILDGARAVFLSDGFDGASMNDIARVAGVSKGTRYVYFDSKERLFEALIREDRKGQVEQLVACAEIPEPRAMLREFGRRLVAMMTQPEHIAHLRVVIAATSKFPSVGQAFYGAGPRHGVGRLAARLDEFVAAGKLDIPDSRRAAQQFIDMSKSWVFQAALFGALEQTSTVEIEACVDAALEVFMLAYGPKSLPAE